jgi:hypothetical protein
MQQSQLKKEAQQRAVDKIVTNPILLAQANPQGIGRDSGGAQDAGDQPGPDV